MKSAPPAGTVRIVSVPQQIAVGSKHHRKLGPHYSIYLESFQSYSAIRDSSKRFKVRSILIHHNNAEMRLTSYKCVSIASINLSNCRVSRRISSRKSEASCELMIWTNISSRFLQSYSTTQSLPSVAEEQKLGRTEQLFFWWPDIMLLTWLDKSEWTRIIYRVRLWIFYRAVPRSGNRLGLRAKPRKSREWATRTQWSRRRGKVPTLARVWDSRKDFLSSAMHFAQLSTWCRRQAVCG